MSALHSFAVEAFTLLALGTAVVGFRTYARARQHGIRNLDVDDYIMLFVIIPYTAEIILAYTVGARFHGLANNAMTDEQRAVLSPDNDEYQWRVNGSKIQIAGWAVYVSVLWLIKSAMCAFYARLTNGMTTSRARVKGGLGLVAITYIIIMATIFLGCRPFHRLWQINPDPGNLCQPAVSKLLIFLVVTLNVVTDIYLMAILIPALWKAKVTKVKKVILVLLFSGGIFVMVAGILRCILILKNPTTGPQQAGSWAVRESFVAVVTSNIPMTWGWLRQKWKPFRLSLLASTRQKEKSTQTDDVTLDDLQGQTLLGNPSRAPGSVNTREHLTRSGNWAQVYTGQLPPAVESKQCKTTITREVDIRVYSSVA